MRWLSNWLGCNIDMEIRGNQIQIDIDNHDELHEYCKWLCENDIRYESDTWMWSRLHIIYLLCVEDIMAFKLRWL